MPHQQLLWVNDGYRPCSCYTNARRPPTDAMPQFNQKYGVLHNGTYEISPEWQSGLSNVHGSLHSHTLTWLAASDWRQGANVGEFIGLLINGWVSERFGYRYTVIACLVLIMAWTSLFFTAQNVQTLLAAEVLAGIVSWNLPPPPPSLPPLRRPSADSHMGRLRRLRPSPGASSKPSPSPTRPRSAPWPCAAT